MRAYGEAPAGGEVMIAFSRVGFRAAALAATVHAAACADPACPSGTSEINERCTPIDDTAPEARADAHSAIGQSGISGSYSSDVAGWTGSETAGAPSASEAGSPSAAPQSDAPGGFADGPSAGSSSGAGVGALAGSGAPVSTPPMSMSGDDTCRPASEACDNQDNDCDGRIDEDIVRPCGPLAQGICRPGVESCVAGQWTGTCEGAVEPMMELCDAAALDENCNGAANEECACTPGMMQECGSDIGNCAKGTQTCDAAGEWAADCIGSAGPAAEACDGRVDEDCDDKIDEGCDCKNGETRPCGMTRGECVEGTNTCSGGRWSITCQGERRAGFETCDSRDNDCDGRTDEGVQNACGGCAILRNRPDASCTSGEGACERSGRFVCQGTDATTCNATAGRATTEDCSNGVDDDCDGVVDNGTNACGGPCSAGELEDIGSSCSVECAGGRGTFPGTVRCSGSQARCILDRLRCILIVDGTCFTTDTFDPCDYIDLAVCMPSPSGCPQ